MFGFCERQTLNQPEIYHILFQVSQEAKERDQSVLDPTTKKIKTVQVDFNNALKAGERERSNATQP